MNWETSFPDTAATSRALQLDLHMFGDASITGTAAAIYFVIYQPACSNISRLSDSKSPIVKGRSHDRKTRT